MWIVLKISWHDSKLTQIDIANEMVFHRANRFHSLPKLWPSLWPFVYFIHIDSLPDPLRTLAITPLEKIIKLQRIQKTSHSNKQRAKPKIQFTFNLRSRLPLLPLKLLLIVSTSIVFEALEIGVSSSATRHRQRSKRCNSWRKQLHGAGSENGSWESPPASAGTAFSTAGSDSRGEGGLATVPRDSGARMLSEDRTFHWRWRTPAPTTPLSPVAASSYS